MTKIIYTSTDLSDPVARRAWGEVLHLAEGARQSVRQARREQAQSRTIIDLFTVKTIVPELHGCEDVVITWYMHRDEPTVPYSQTIADYDPADEFIAYAEAAVDGYFTREEVESLLTFLEREQPHLSHRTEMAPLPVPRDAFPSNALPTGGSALGWHYGPENGWPMKVDGYTDLRDYQPAPGRIADLARRRAFKSNRFQINPGTGEVIC